MRHGGLGAWRPLFEFHRNGPRRATVSFHPTSGPEEDGLVLKDDTQLKSVSELRDLSKLRGLEELHTASTSDAPERMPWMRRVEAQVQLTRGGEVLLSRDGSASGDVSRATSSERTSRKLGRGRCGSVPLAPVTALVASLAPVPEPASLIPQRFNPPIRTEYTKAWDGEEAIGTAGSEEHAAGDARQLHLLPSLLSAEERRTVLAAAAERSAAFDTTTLDTVDDKATFLLNVIDEGEVVDETIYAAIAPLLQERLTPFVRTKFDAPGACVADVLIRRYLPSERRRLEAHFDTSSFVTAVVALSDACDYVGGLYVQAVPGVTSRRYVPLNAGDCLVHQFDTMHGVQVKDGFRLSLVVWFSDSEKSLKAGHAPWAKRAAENGNPEAMHVLGCLHATGDFGYKADAQLAVHWITQAAVCGNALALMRLGLMLSEGEIDANEAQEIAAEFGEDGEDAECALPVALYKRAAAQGHPTAQYLLGRAYRLGEGVEADPKEAESWLRLAAAQGADEVDAAGWAEADLELLAMPAALADEWARLSVEEQQQALDEVNREQQANGEAKWDMAAIMKVMELQS